MAHCNHYYLLYQRRQCNRIPVSFRTMRSHCKSVLVNVKCSYAQPVQVKVENKILGYSEFWKIEKVILSRRKPSVPSIINGPEFI